jgi:hypothetical protein
VLDTVVVSMFATTEDILESQFWDVVLADPQLLEDEFTELTAGLLDRICRPGPPSCRLSMADRSGAGPHHHTRPPTDLAGHAGQSGTAAGGDGMERGPPRNRTPSGPQHMSQNGGDV